MKTDNRNQPQRFRRIHAGPRFLHHATVGIACLFLPILPSNAAPEGALPNIIIIYADDLGYGDLSCYHAGCAYKTPRLDRMAAEGIRFTDAHSPSTICSPSRCGLFSGQQIYRSTGRGGGAFEGPGGPSYLKPGTLTLGAMLKQKGYRTGVFGKWHVGLTWLDKDGKRLGGGFKNSLLIDYEKSTPLVDGPNARGFDESFVTPNCPTTDPLYIYIENGMLEIERPERAPKPGSRRDRQHSEDREELTRERHGPKAYPGSGLPCFAAPQSGFSWAREPAGPRGS